MYTWDEWRMLEDGNERSIHMVSSRRNRKGKFEALSFVCCKILSLNWIELD